MRRPSLPLRLSALPAAAALTVLVIALLSIVDLEGMRKSETADEPDTLQFLKRQGREGLVPRSEKQPLLDEAEALRRMAEAPERAAAERLWALPEHRDLLFKALLSTATQEELRLYLLGRFEAEALPRALEAARALARGDDQRHGILLQAAYEIISLHGNSGDLPLLAERRGESHQSQTFREMCRDSLRGRHPTKS